MVEAFCPSRDYTLFMSREFSETAALLSEPGRSAMLMALIDGRALPAGQLAMIANVAPQTASSHLIKMVDGELLAVEQQGRHRYYRLANAEVAHAIEALMAIAPQPKAQPRTEARRPLPGSTLASARTCYSHLAGRLAVDIADALQKRGLLASREAKQFTVSQRGREWFGELGVEISEQQMKEPRFARQCLDWTERRHHIAGRLGSAMLTRFRELKWVAPIRDTRAVRVTLEGERRLWDLLQVNARDHSR
jgi:DNA-binding transcriptional ArsR family regulator